MSGRGFTPEQVARGLETRRHNAELRKQGLLPPRKSRKREEDPAPLPEQGAETATEPAAAPIVTSTPDPADLFAAVVRRDAQLREQVARALGRLEGWPEPLAVSAVAILTAALRGEVAP